MLNTCGGLALMAGYNSPLGKMTLHYCFAGVKAGTATLDLVSVFFVDVPVMACICQQGEGRNPTDWIVHHCESPDGLRPMLRTIMDRRDQCPAALQRTTDSLTGVFVVILREIRNPVDASTTGAGLGLAHLGPLVRGQNSRVCGLGEDARVGVILTPVIHRATLGLS